MKNVILFLILGGTSCVDLLLLFFADNALTFELRAIPWVTLL